MWLSLWLAFVVLGVACEGHSCVERRWPKVMILVPVHLQEAVARQKARDRNGEFIDFFLRSFKLFWPEHSNTSIRVLFDAEKNASSQVADFRRLVTEKHAPVDYGLIEQSPWYNDNSFYRQQYAMFWGDNYTSPDVEYVGFADSDTAFSAYVDRDDLFDNEGRKPVINARWGAETHAPWRNVPMTTYGITGKEEPMRCMSYFPVIIKRAHLAEIREHIRRHLGKSTFDEAFQTFSGYFSQFNIFCAVLWWREDLRSQYSWYVNDYTPQWDGFNNPKPNPGQWSDRSIYSPSMFAPKPRVAIHVRWHNHWANGRPTVYNTPEMFTEMLQRGVCDSPPFPKHQAFCLRWQTEGRVSYNSSVLPGDQFSGFNKELHSFEFVDYYEAHNVSALLQVHKDRIERISSCPPIIEQDMIV